MTCDICGVSFHYKCVVIPRQKKNDDAWLCSTYEKLDTTLKWYPNSNIELPAYIHYFMFRYTLLFHDRRKFWYLTWINFPKDKVLWFCKLFRSSKTIQAKLLGVRFLTLEYYQGNSLFNPMLNRGLHVIHVKYQNFSSGNPLAQL